MYTFLLSQLDIYSVFPAVLNQVDFPYSLIWVMACFIAVDMDQYSVASRDSNFAGNAKLLKIIQIIQV